MNTVPNTQVAFKLPTGNYAAWYKGQFLGIRANKKLAVRLVTRIIRIESLK